METVFDCPVPPFVIQHFFRIQHFACCQPKPSFIMARSFRCRWLWLFFASLFQKFLKAWVITAADTPDMVDTDGTPFGKGMCLRSSSRCLLIRQPQYLRNRRKENVTSFLSPFCITHLSLHAARTVIFFSFSRETTR